VISDEGSYWSLPFSSNKESYDQRRLIEEWILKKKESEKTINDGVIEL